MNKHIVFLSLISLKKRERNKDILTSLRGQHGPQDKWYKIGSVSTLHNNDDWINSNRNSKA